ncbi:MAG: hypothetical protein LBC74_04710 [Planctomycetaceae bacterium]|nr:hypothetical protein [Planctomycetaceae bacterium]
MTTILLYKPNKFTRNNIIFRTALIDLFSNLKIHQHNKKPPLTPPRPPLTPPKEGNYSPPLEGQGWSPTG